MSRHSTVDIKNYFQFHDLKNSELGYTIRMNQSDLDCQSQLSQGDMDRLSQLRFIPFKSNQNTALSDNNFEFDSLFDINKIQCDYFSPEEFKKRIEN